jgi:hypothetical protein
MNEEKSYQFESIMIIDDNLIDLYISSRIITKTISEEKYCSIPLQ